MARLRIPLFAAVAITVALAATPLFAQQSLDDDAVLKMMKGGLSDDLIVQTIKASPGQYATTPDDLMRLKKAGVSDKVMGAMISRNAGPAAAPAAPLTSTTTPATNGVAGFAGVDEIGVYYKDPTGHWTQLSPEIINFKSGGVMKSIATNGILKGDKNGHLPGKTAKQVLTRQTDVLIYGAEGVSPEEYQLLRLRVNSDNREFRSETGGVFHSSGGAQRDAVVFTPVKVAPRMYQFTLALDMPIGEYGILPPGSMATSNAASAGKMFTFKTPRVVRRPHAHSPERSATGCVLLKHARNSSRTGRPV